MQRQQARVKSLENLVEAKNEALASKQDEIEGKDLEIKVRDSQIRQLRASFAQLSTTVSAKTVAYRYEYQTPERQRYQSRLGFRLLCGTCPAVLYVCM